MSRRSSRQSLLYISTCGLHTGGPAVLSALSVIQNHQLCFPPLINSFTDDPSKFDCKIHSHSGRIFCCSGWQMIGRRRDAQYGYAPQSDCKRVIDLLQMEEILEAKAAVQRTTSQEAAALQESLIPVNSDDIDCSKLASPQPNRWKVCCKPPWGRAHGPLKRQCKYCMFIPCRCSYFDSIRSSSR